METRLLNRHDYPGLCYTCKVVNKAGKSYVPLYSWNIPDLFPGGGLEGNETPETGALREHRDIQARHSI